MNLNNLLVAIWNHIVKKNCKKLFVFVNGAFYCVFSCMQFLVVWRNVSTVKQLQLYILFNKQRSIVLYFIYAYMDGWMNERDYDILTWEENLFISRLKYSVCHTQIYILCLAYVNFKILNIIWFLLWLFIFFSFSFLRLFNVSKFNNNRYGCDVFKQMLAFYVNFKLKTSNMLRFFKSLESC